MPESILEWGIALILLLQSLGDWLVGPMNLFTFTGNIEFYLLILPAIYWSWDTRLGLRVAIIFLLGLAINLITKVLFHDPRPYWFEPEVRLLTGTESSFGIPSGHAQNSVMIWGMLAVYLRKTWAWLGAVILIFFIGFSRIYLGVHFPTDVLTGWIMGIIALILFLQLEASVSTQFNKLGQISQVAIIFGISLLLILIGALLINQVSASWRLPAEWIQNAAADAPDEPIAPFSIQDLIITTSTFFGFIAGAILFKARLSFNAGGSWGKRLGRYLVGAVGVFILWQGLGALFDLVAVDESMPGYILRYIRYTLIGGWISALAPWLFLKMKLA
jgi:membrane-associated phospholipid phosphatase